MRYQVVLPDDIAGWVVDTARREGRSVSAWLRRLIERERDRVEKPAAFVAKAHVPIPAVAPSIAALREQTLAVVQKPKHTALPSSSDGRGGA